LSRILNEITLILDALLRSRHLSVETCHPHVQFSISPARTKPAGLQGYADE
jgi:hypothetical protein